MKTTTLDNGMKIIFYERPCTSFLTFAVSVNVGSDDESKNYGIAHFLEHVIFDGTKDRTEHEIFDQIESVGGEINANTDDTNTIYYATVPNGHEQLAVDVISDMLLNPVITADSIDREKSVIYNEMAKGEDNAPVRLERIVLESITGKPTTIGTRKSISSMTRGAVVEFYKKWYIPNNMTAIVVGQKSIFDEIASKFSSIEPSRMPARQKVLAAVNPSERSVMVRRGTDVEYTAIAFPTIPYPDVEACHVDLMTAVLNRTGSGRIFKELRIKRGLIYHATVFHYITKRYGVFIASFSCKKDKTDECKRLILEEIGKVDVIDGNELSSSKNYIGGIILSLKEQNISVAEQISYWDSFGDANTFNEYMKYISATRKKDISAVKNKYFSGDHFEATVT